MFDFKQPISYRAGVTANADKSFAEGSTSDSASDSTQIAAVRVPDSRPTLQTHRLQLRPFDAADADRFETLINDEQIAIHTHIPVYPLPPGSAAHWIAAHRDLWLSGRAVIFAICPLDQAGIIGATGLEISIDDHRGELGYWLGRPYWNQGFASEAAAAVVAFGLDDLALNKISASCLASNHASRRVLEKVGFKQEGIQRKHLRHWGRYHDVECWGMLHEDR